MAAHVPPGQPYYASRDGLLCMAPRLGQPLWLATHRLSAQHGGVLQFRARSSADIIVLVSRLERANCIRRDAQDEFMESSSRAEYEFVWGSHCNTKVLLRKHGVVRASCKTPAYDMPSAESLQTNSGKLPSGPSRKAAEQARRQWCFGAYWVAARNGMFAMGQGEVPGDQCLLRWVDPDPQDYDIFGLSCWDQRAVFSDLKLSPVDNTLFGAGWTEQLDTPSHLSRHHFTSLFRSRELFDGEFRVRDTIDSGSSCRAHAKSELAVVRFHAAYLSFFGGRLAREIIDGWRPEDARTVVELPQGYAAQDVNLLVRILYGEVERLPNIESLAAITDLARLWDIQGVLEALDWVWNVWSQSRNAGASCEDDFALTVLPVTRGNTCWLKFSLARNKDSYATNVNWEIAIADQLALEAHFRRIFDSQSFSNVWLVPRQSNRDTKRRNMRIGSQMAGAAACNRALLAHRSSFFKAMFTSCMCESRDSIVLLDAAVDVNVCTTLVKYLYCRLEADALEALRLEQLVSLLVLAEVQNLGALRTLALCMTYARISTENVVALGNVALLLNAPILFARCADFLTDHFEALLDMGRRSGDCVQGSRISDMHKDFLFHILLRADICTSSELTVFRFMWAWIVGQQPDSSATFEAQADEAMHDGSAKVDEVKQVAESTVHRDMILRALQREEFQIGSVEAALSTEATSKGSDCACRTDSSSPRSGSLSCPTRKHTTSLLLSDADGPVFLSDLLSCLHIRRLADEELALVADMLCKLLRKHGEDLEVGRLFGEAWSDVEASREGRQTHTVGITGAADAKDRNWFVMPNESNPLLFVDVAPLLWQPKVFRTTFERRWRFAEYVKLLRLRGRRSCRHTRHSLDQALEICIPYVPEQGASGVLQFLAQHSVLPGAWMNPVQYGLVTVRASSRAHFSALGFVRPQGAPGESYVVSDKSGLKWISIDLGPNLQLSLYGFSLLHDDSAKDFLRSWIIEAQQSDEDPSLKKSSDEIDGEWTRLCEMHNDSSLTFPRQRAVWEITDASPRKLSFSRFRIRAVPDNGSGKLVLAGMELFGRLRVLNPDAGSLGMFSDAEIPHPLRAQTAYTHDLQPV
ncbi:E3 ubiquitin-protein ligase HECTD1 [Porphyridium purpureum]|uniref:E3 ubiquitin-protein ligase HECTD1 n=1 Tax=Porphyridium purpureum TaxID=35688 RepID=A0A5J4Z4R8_PORPP|nr:E3 ubiquitin-protein ligase HECTD1 [Porphyridium purpureum]|eukprot:POR2708..scf295_1